MAAGAMKICTMACTRPRAWYTALKFIITIDIEEDVTAGLRIQAAHIYAIYSE